MPLPNQWGIIMVVSIELLRDLIDYNPETGEMVRKKRTSNRISVGDRAGTLRPDGYLKISICNKSLLAHRAAWAIHHGKWPDGEIDHINGCRADNRIANLRDVSPQVNQQNRRSAKNSSVSGRIGITYHKRLGKWQAQIMTPSGYNYLGVFDSDEDAFNAYLEAKRKLHQGCTI